LNFPDELTDVIELSVNRNVADVGHGIDVMELVHDLGTNARGRNLMVVILVEFTEDFVDRASDSIHRDFSFFASLHEAAEEFLAIHGFPAAVALDDPEFGPLHLLVGCEAGSAIQALAPPPNRRAIFGRSRIDNFVLLVTALDATHNFDLGRWRKDSKEKGVAKAKISVLTGKSGRGRGRF